ncbi:class I SAM-dependent DNA methyltransferase [Sandarakinorhabdus sp. DWP1-3-1]|uniref:class I SAM-dependent DNA methyltransferase n=1 Tax=Sandarakinorhabdus sp. DWP1-3-1 TaxID=2804627 RepID=UPI003CECCAB1
MIAPALQPGYFDALYEGSADPWGFETSPYEDAKYAATLAALEGRHYADAIEVGCSIGVLTARLAPSCDNLLGTDVAEAALAIARKRCAAQPQARFALSTLPDRPPPGRFDLILLSEVLYYFDDAGIARTADAVRARRSPARTSCWCIGSARRRTIPR